LDDIVVDRGFVAGECFVVVRLFGIILNTVLAAILATLWVGAWSSPCNHIRGSSCALVVRLNAILVETDKK
jgi:hypothetical protein